MNVGSATSVAPLFLLLGPPWMIDIVWKALIIYHSSRTSRCTLSTKGRYHKYFAQLNRIHFWHISTSKGEPTTTTTTTTTTTRYRWWLKPCTTKDLQSPLSFSTWHIMINSYIYINIYIYVWFYPTINRHNDNSNLHGREKYRMLTGAGFVRSLSTRSRLVLVSNRYFPKKRLLMAGTFPEWCCIYCIYMCF